MEENGTEAGGLSLQALAREIAELRAESAEQKRMIARLEAKSSRHPSDLPNVRSVASTKVRPRSSSVDHASPGGDRVSRRGALHALGAVAVGGAGLAIGSTILGAEPAAA